MHSYRIATTYSTYLNTQSNHQQPLTLPSIIREERADLQKQQVQVQNMFEGKRMDRMEEKAFSQLFGQGYSWDFVGIKEMKGLKNMGKKRKHYSGIKKGGTQTAISLSRISSIRSQKQTYLSKDQVLKQKFPLNAISLNITPSVSPHKKKDIKTSFMVVNDEAENGNLQKSKRIGIMNKDSKYKEEKKQKLENIQRKADQNSKMTRLTSDQNKKSLSKVKEKLIEYEAHWKKQIFQRQQKCQIFDTSKKNYKNTTLVKHSSVLELASAFRSTVQEQSRLQLKSEQAHLSPTLWNTTLRGERDLGNYFKQKLVPQIDRSCQLKGQNKLKRQLQWIQNKQQAGYLFKICEDGVNEYDDNKSRN